MYNNIDDSIDYRIRAAKPDDLEQVAEVEAGCFPAAEAAGMEALRQRMEAFCGCFFVAEETDGRIIGFINGCITSERTIRDEMFENTGLHEEEGEYQSIFGLDVIRPFRRRGVAAALMNHMIEEARRAGRKGLILTCKDRLIPYYERFGYRNLGVSASVHGGAVWYDMILEFPQETA